MLDRKDHSKENRQTVVGSKIVAKATLRLPNGSHEIVTVFAQSPRLEFYWVFKARSPRSGRRSWKYAGHYPRDVGFGDQAAYRDFGSFVQHYARTRGAEVLRLRLPHKRWLASLLAKTAHDSIYANWTPQDRTMIRTDSVVRKNRFAGRRFAW